MSDLSTLSSWFINTFCYRFAMSVFNDWGILGDYLFGALILSGLIIIFKKTF